jgi:hypothetical protein
MWFIPVLFLLSAGVGWWAISSQDDSSGEVVIFSALPSAEDHSHHSAPPIMVPSTQTSTSTATKVPTSSVPTTEATTPYKAPGHHEHVPTKDRPAKPVEVTYKGEDGRTATGILRDIRHVSFVDGEQGPVLLGIDGTTVNPDKGEKWVCYVNGVENETPYFYVTKDTDSITWRVEN